MAQKSVNSKKIEIHVSKDGKSISRTYSSEEAMENDEELKEFLGDHGMVMVQSGDSNVIIGDSDSEYVQVIDSDTEGKEIAILSEADENMDSKAVRYSNKVIMVEKSEGATVEVYNFSEEDELPEDVQKMIKENNGLAVVSGKKADKDRFLDKGNRVYPSEKRFVSTLDIDTNLKENTIGISFTADAKPTDVKLTDEDGKELYQKSIADFDGTFNEKIKLKRFKGRAVYFTIEQNGVKSTEKINLD
ncbi:MAG: hypothetical protein WBB45_16915 [Cyclobacteriaceae bacterium]